MSEITYRVKGMMCGHCQKFVQDTLAGIKGVEKVEVLLEQGKATIHTAGDSSLDFDQVKAAFAGSNYIVEQQ